MTKLQCTCSSNYLRWDDSLKEFLMVFDTGTRSISDFDFYTLLYEKEDIKKVKEFEVTFYLEEVEDLIIIGYCENNLYGELYSTREAVTEYLYKIDECAHLLYSLY